jgi:murein DD-endopeptidase MepM/ murein hydrolase activator NlpD
MALPVLALLAPGTASAARYDGWSAESGSDPVATIRDLDVDRDAIVPGGAPLELSFTSTEAQHVRIIAFDASGRTVRTIVDAPVAAGAQHFTWEGARSDGTRVADGEYELVVEAGSARDSLSVSDVVRVDTHAPTVRTPVAQVRLTRGSRSFRLPIVASESALVEVRTAGTTGRSRTAGARTFGRSEIVVPVANRATLARALRSGRARVRVTLVATDPAGNRTARSTNVDLLPPASPASGSGSVDPGPVAGSSNLSWPLIGPLTSRYGPRWGRMHNGIDVGVPTGRPIGSAAPGRVTYAGWMSGYGNTVIVDHGTLETLYGHQSKIRVRVGQSVSRGQVVGLVGSTGNSTGPHLHFEVRVGGAAKDPLKYLP